MLADYYKEWFPIGGKVVGRYGLNYLTVHFETTGEYEQFPIEDVFDFQVVEPNEIAKALDLGDLIVWATVTSDFYGPDVHNKREKATEMIGRNFVHIAALNQDFPLADLKIEIKERTVFSPKSVRLSEWIMLPSYIPLIVKYFKSEFNPFVFVPMFEKELDVQTTAQDQQIIASMIESSDFWQPISFSLDANIIAKFAEATNEQGVELCDTLDTDNLFQDMVNDAQKHPDDLRFLHVQDTFRKIKFKRCPKYQKIITAINLIVRRLEDGGQEFSTAVGIGDSEEDGNELLPDEEEIIPKDVVRSMKDRDTTKSFIEKSRNDGKHLDWCYDTLIEMYLELIRAWEEANDQRIKRSQNPTRKLIGFHITMLLDYALP